MDSENDNKKILIELEVQNRKKDSAVAYVLWFFFGWMGGHRLYLDRVGSAFGIMGTLVLAVLLLLSGYFAAAALAFAVWIIWPLVDAFLIPGIIRDDMDNIRDELWYENDVRFEFND